MKQINDLQFVQNWVDAANKGAGVQHVATKMGITVESASAKANNLRTKGVNLPRMQKSNNLYTVDALNAAIERKQEQFNS